MPIVSHDGQLLKLGSGAVQFVAGEARKKKDGALRCRERLGGLLKYYEREAA